MEPSSNIGSAHYRMDDTYIALMYDDWLVGISRFRKYETAAAIAFMAFGVALLIIFGWRSPAPWVIVAVGAADVLWSSTARRRWVVRMRKTYSDATEVRVTFSEAGICVSTDESKAEMTWSNFELQPTPRGLFFRRKGFSLYVPDDSLSSSSDKSAILDAAQRAHLAVAHARHPMHGG